MGNNHAHWPQPKNLHLHAWDWVMANWAQPKSQDIPEHAGDAKKKLELGKIFTQTISAQFCAGRNTFLGNCHHHGGGNPRTIVAVPGNEWLMKKYLLVAQLTTQVGFAAIFLGCCNYCFRNALTRRFPLDLVDPICSKKLKDWKTYWEQ